MGNKEDIAVTALDVANYFIFRSHQENKVITNKKLQKLLYYAQAWHMVLRKKPLFPDDIEAWVHGPAVRAVYDKYKNFGFSGISEQVEADGLDKLPAKDLLEEVWRVYGKFDADYLEELTHNEEPWLSARSGLDAHIASNNVIDRAVMERYYSDKLTRARSK